MSIVALHQAMSSPADPGPAWLGRRRARASSVVITALATLAAFAVMLAGAPGSASAGSSAAAASAARHCTCDGGGTSASRPSHIDRSLDHIRRTLDKLNKHLTPQDLDAARRELRGQVVKRRNDGKPFDHVHEVRDAQNGLMKRIAALKGILRDANLTPAQRGEAQRLLGNASRLLDHTEKFVPRQP